MQFNKITRGANNAWNDEQKIYEILDEGFLCHVAFHHNAQAMIIPTCYGRLQDHIFIHGSSKNQMLNGIRNGQALCISVTHVDGIVLARNLFHSSVNYRSAILFGKAEVVSDPFEKRDALKIICENIIAGRSAEVPLGSEKDINATLVIKVKIETASAKVRAGAPRNDDDLTNDIWSGAIPLSLKAGKPIADAKWDSTSEWSDSVRLYVEKNG